MKTEGKKIIMAMFFVVWVITAMGQTAFLEAANGSYASNPYPADGAVIVGDIVGGNIFTELIFVPGATAVEHTGYFSDDYSKVESRHPDANLGPPPYGQLPDYKYTFWVGNPAVPPADETLVRGVTYYWCVDETDSLGTTYPGDIWEFTILGFYAFEPSPPNEATFVETDVLLSWKPGYGAEEHDVYIGTDFNDVNNAIYDHFNPPPEFLATRSEPNILVTGLAFDTAYYWRVDEIIGRGPPFFIPTEFYKGDVWSFTTVPEGLGTIRMDLWWNLRCPGIICLFDDIDYPDNPDETRFLTSFNSGENLGENYGGQIHGWLHPRKSGDYTFWIASDDDSELFLSSDESPVNMERIAYVRLWTAPYEWYDNIELNQVSVPISLVAGQKYYIMARWTEQAGGDHCMVAWQGPDQPLAPVSGSADAVIPGSRLSPFVQFWAHGPDPRDGQTDVALPVNLSWEPGDNAFEHNIYLGTNFNDVNKAVYDPRYPPPAVFLATTTEPNILVTGLVFDTTYYWRVDEIPPPMPPPWPSSPYYKGNVWSFTTGLPVGQTYHVDGVNGDNTNDGLTRETAFKTIQRGINVAEDLDTVLVWPGVYNEEISFWGDAITVRSAADAAIVETDYGYAFSFFSAEEADTVLSNFVIRNSQYGIYLINGASPTLRNLTIVDNDFGISAFNGADPDISSCIFWNNYYGDLFRDPVPLQARYSCIEEGGEGEGNISIEPGFVDAAGGDYHLLSERGRYWPVHDVWVLDDVTSPCIDGGDPTIDPSNERMPNGGRINMGACGNTAYASMSECWSKSDFNCDGIVNFRDFAIFVQDWLETALVIPGPNVPDVTPPAPAPVIITIGAVSSSSIRMTASEAFDESGVQYYFEARSPGGHDSGWIGSRTYTDVNLDPNTTYCYRVKARDKSANHNETIWSPQVCAVTVVLPDTLPPLPDPMQWDDQVDANGYDGRPLEVYFPLYDVYGATMRAIDADDQAPAGAAPAEVEYYFQCQDDSGFNSGWRTVAAYPNEDDRRTYTVQIGFSGHAYRFRVKARDASNNLNETDWSDWYPAVYRDPP